MPIVTKLDVVMAQRSMSLTELSDKVQITMANLSNLKRGKARAIRFSTLDALCDALRCQPADIIQHRTKIVKKDSGEGVDLIALLKKMYN